MRKFILVILGIVILLIQQPSNVLSKDRFDFEKAGDAIWEGETDEKIVALTFDDGPHPDYTPEILDILEQYNMKGTFYVMGAHARKYPGLVFRAFLEGHEIGNHTFTHNGSITYLNDELTKTNEIIEKITGKYPATFRPVGGNYNETVISIAKKKGQKVAMWAWDQDTRDWDDVDSKTIANQVIGNLSPGDIILFHDAGGDRTPTIEALPIILRFFKEEGYEGITVTDMIERTSER
ncbi:oligosaccharide deacetylase [Oceanobacillus iheyensis HTE831]|uniref:Oligosaccharide deacetylase n=1 Tax=Oceanobacillus iheyensis (strain DSM 14371 / CIP 107618 / JCM 11309 / KCTC 3954 / HTE831) TaxID=221109 RepID=Q8EPK0_OCEIH|nr:polysaccharide deacetylase family protein [Oceanobacillus iheyensis]BAC14057.1 oligosaccharide deacetylase [Oceanobacillus iheyensis HTE831]